MKYKRTMTLVLDIDFTLNTDNPREVIKWADDNNLSYYSREVWDRFESKAKDMSIPAHNIPKKHYDEIVSLYKRVVIITGRPERFRKWSEQWLDQHNFYYDELLMRPNDREEMSSREVKEYLANKHGLFKTPENYVAIDDDDGVVDYYRSLGVLTFKAPDDWNKALKYHQNMKVVTYV